MAETSMQNLGAPAVQDACGAGLGWGHQNVQARCGDTIQGRLMRCLGCRVMLLERDSHPPKPTLDADEAQALFDRLLTAVELLEVRANEAERKIAAAESELGVNL